MLGDYADLSEFAALPPSNTMPMEPKPIWSCIRILILLKFHEILKVESEIQMKLILLCVWAEPAALGSTKTALKFKYEI